MTATGRRRPTRQIARGSPGSKVPALGCACFERNNFEKTKIVLVPSGKSGVDGVLVQLTEGEPALMSDQSCDLAKIAKLNGDFRKNYGTLLGAFLYLRSISAARGRSWLLAGLISMICSAALAWVGKVGLSWLHVE